MTEEENELFKGESFTLGMGISFYVDPDAKASDRNLMGYLASFSVEKKFFNHFLLTSGIDSYTIPRSNIRLVGNINLNLMYFFKVSDKVTVSLGTGLFTGFIHRINSSGINSGALIGTRIKYKLNKKFDVGINIKYPFFSESAGILLTNAFITF